MNKNYSFLTLCLTEHLLHGLTATQLQAGFNPTTGLAFDGAGAGNLNVSTYGHLFFNNWHVLLESK